MPSINYWNDKQDTNPYLGPLMLGYSWMLWVLNVFFMLIIMLNFLIASISESYTGVIKREQIILYETRAILNIESLLIINLYKSLTTQTIESSCIYILKANADSAEVENPVS